MGLENSSEDPVSLRASTLRLEEFSLAKPNYDKQISATKAFGTWLERAEKAGLHITIRKYSVQLRPEDKDDCRKTEPPVTFHSTPEDVKAFSDIVKRRERQEKKILGNRERIRQLEPAANEVGFTITPNSLRANSHYLSVNFFPADGYKVTLYYPVTTDGVNDFARDIAERQSKMSAVEKLRPRVEALVPLANSIGVTIKPQSDLEFFFAVYWPHHRSAYPYDEDAIKHFEESLKQAKAEADAGRSLKNFGPFEGYEERGVGAS